MGDEVVRVRGHLQSLALDKWRTVEQRHARNVSWLREELEQISHSLEIKVRFEAKEAALAPFPSLEDALEVSQPVLKKQKVEEQKYETRKSLRPRAESVEVDTRTRKRGRPSQVVLQDPGKLKVVELRSELKKRGLRSSGLKAVLFDRLLDALEEEQKEDAGDNIAGLKETEEEEQEDAGQINKLEEEEQQVIVIDDETEDEQEVIVIDDDDEDEIVRESIGSDKSPGGYLPSQTTAPEVVLSGEDADNVVEFVPEVEGDPYSSPPDPRSRDGEGANAGHSSRTEETPAAGVETAMTALETEADEREQQVLPSEMNSSSTPGIEFAVDDGSKDLITHDDLKLTRKSIQFGGRRSELSSPLAWKRKSILRKASSLAPSTRGLSRKVSFAPTDKVDIIFESSQTDSTQPDPSPQKSTLSDDAHSPRRDIEDPSPDAFPEAQAKVPLVGTLVGPDSASTSPKDPTAIEDVSSDTIPEAKAKPVGTRVTRAAASTSPKDPTDIEDVSSDAEGKPQSVETPVAPVSASISRKDPTDIEDISSDAEAKPQSVGTPVAPASVSTSRKDPTDIEDISSDAEAKPQSVGTPVAPASVSTSRKDPTDIEDASSDAEAKPQSVGTPVAPASTSTSPKDPTAIEDVSSDTFPEAEAKPVGTRVTRAAASTSPKDPTDIEDASSDAEAKPQSVGTPVAPASTSTSPKDPTAIEGVSSDAEAKSQPIGTPVTPVSASISSNGPTDIRATRSDAFPEAQSVGAPVAPASTSFLPNDPVYIEDTSSDAFPEAKATQSVGTPVVPAPASVPPKDPTPTQVEPEKETEEERKEREFQANVARETQRLRLAAKLSAQKRLGEAKAKAFWVKSEQLKLRTSSAGNKKSGALTPMPSSDKSAADHVSPPISTSESSSAASNGTRTQGSIISPRLEREGKNHASVRPAARQDEVEEISNVSSTFESLLHEPGAPRSTYSAVEYKHEVERLMSHRLGDKPTAKSMPVTVTVPHVSAESHAVGLDIIEKVPRQESDGSSFLTSMGSYKGVPDKKPHPPKMRMPGPFETRNRSDSLSSTVSSIPETSVVETTLKAGASITANGGRRIISNLVGGLHSFTSLLEKKPSQESNSGRSAPVVTSLKLAERSRAVEEKKRLEKEKRKAILKKKMGEHKKAAALKEKAEKDAQAKREQERQNERKKREAELARNRHQKLREMRAGIEKKRAMRAAEKKSAYDSATAESRSAATATSASYHKHRGLASASEAPQPVAKQKPVSNHVPKPVSKPAPVSKSAPKPTPKPVLTTPPPARQALKNRSPEIVNYEMSDKDSSDSESERPGKKKVPRWAQKDHLNKILHAQFGNKAVDPSPAVFQDFVDTCDLETIFETTDIRKKKKFARRTSSGNWLADRPTARDRALYQRDMGYER